MAPKSIFGEGEAVDGHTVVDTPAPNLFDGLDDPLELEPMNNTVKQQANDIAPQKFLAPGIARLMRLMELSKKAKAVHAAAALRPAAKPPPKAIRYIFPSERKI